MSVAYQEYIQSLPAELPPVDPEEIGDRKRYGLAVDTTQEDWLEQLAREVENQFPDIDLLWGGTLVPQENNFIELSFYA